MSEDPLAQADDALRQVLRVVADYLNPNRDLEAEEAMDEIIAALDEHPAAIRVQRGDA
jgi:hypothetical protein